MTPEEKMVDDERFLSLDWLHEQFGKPAGFSPAEWTNSPLFWYEIARDGMDRDEVVIEDGEATWCLWRYALKHGEEMFEDNPDHESEDFLQWFVDALQEEEDANVAARMRRHGESERQARAVVWRYY